MTFALNVNLAGAQSAKASVNGSCATGPVCQVTFSGTSGASSLAESQVVVVNGMMYMELGAPLASELPTPSIQSRSSHRVPNSRRSSLERATFLRFSRDSPRSARHGD